MRIRDSFVLPNAAKIALSAGHVPECLAVHQPADGIIDMIFQEDMLEAPFADNDLRRLGNRKPLTSSAALSKIKHRECERSRFSVSPRHRLLLLAVPDQGSPLRQIIMIDVMGVAEKLREFGRRSQEPQGTPNRFRRSRQHHELHRATSSTGSSLRTTPAVRAIRQRAPSGRRKGSASATKADGAPALCAGASYAHERTVNPPRPAPRHDLFYRLIHLPTCASLGVRQEPAKGQLHGERMPCRTPS